MFSLKPFQPHIPKPRSVTCVDLGVPRESSRLRGLAQGVRNWAQTRVVSTASLASTVGADGRARSQPRSRGKRRAKGCARRGRGRGESAPGGRGSSAAATGLGRILVGIGISREACWSYHRESFNFLEQCRIGRPRSRTPPIRILLEGRTGHVAGIYYNIPSHTITYYNML